MSALDAGWAEEPFAIKDGKGVPRERRSVLDEIQARDLRQVPGMSHDEAAPSMTAAVAIRRPAVPTDLPAARSLANSLPCPAGVPDYRND